MMLTNEQKNALYGRKRAAVRDTRRLWPRGVVHYVIDRSLGNLLSIIAVKNRGDIAGLVIKRYKLSLVEP